MISDTPGRGGEGGSKKGKFLRTSFMDGPLFLDGYYLHTYTFIHIDIWLICLSDDGYFDF